MELPSLHNRFDRTQKPVIVIFHKPSGVDYVRYASCTRKKREKKGNVEYSIIH